MGAADKKPKKNICAVLVVALRIGFLRAFNLCCCSSNGVWRKEEKGRLGGRGVWSTLLWSLMIFMSKRMLPNKSYIQCFDEWSRRSNAIMLLVEHTMPISIEYATSSRNKTVWIGKVEGKPKGRRGRRGSKEIAK